MALYNRKIHGQDNINSYLKLPEFQLNIHLTSQIRILIWITVEDSIGRLYKECINRTFRSYTKCFRFKDNLDLAEYLSSWDSKNAYFEVK